MHEHAYQELREAMVATQLRDRDITDPRVLARMETVPRHCFVPRDRAREAYGDHPVAIGDGQTISQPYMVACMTALLALEGTEHVLEIGTGSGYQTAVLAGLCRDVVSVESSRLLFERARASLGQLHIENVTLHCGDGTVGYEAEAPYDAILVTAGSPRIPAALTEQLAEGGRLVCPVGDRRQQQLLHVRKAGGELTTTAHTNCIFVPLVGADGWETSRP